MGQFRTRVKLESGIRDRMKFGWESWKTWVDRSIPIRRIFNRVCECGKFPSKIIASEHSTSDHDTWINCWIFPVTLPNVIRATWTGPMRKPSARISGPLVIYCLKSEKGIFFCFIIWDEASFSCYCIDKKTPTRWCGRIKTRTCGRRGWRHSITIQTIWTISVHCPKSILINEQLVQWCIYCEWRHIINFSGVQRILARTSTLGRTKSVLLNPLLMMYRPGNWNFYKTRELMSSHSTFLLWTDLVASLINKTVVFKVKTVPWTLSKVSGFEFGVV